MSNKPYDNPPAYPQPAHYDANHAPSPSPSPYNAYGGFANPSDPRAVNYPGSPAPGNYGPPQQQQYYAPQGQPGYGPPQGQPGYGAPQGMYYGGQQQGYPQQGGYYQNTRGRSSASEGICAGLFGALACCCCLDFLI